jgi:hypothetical protein
MAGAQVPQEKKGEQPVPSSSLWPLSALAETSVVQSSPAQQGIKLPVATSNNRNMDTHFFTNSKIGYKQIIS